MRKKTLSVLFFAVCPLLLSAADAFCTPKQLSLADVDTLLRNGVSNERIAEIVRTHGVAFDLKESEAKKLKRELTLLPLFGLIYFTVCGGSFGA